MLAGLRIDGHTADWIEDFSVGRMGGVTTVLPVMMRARVMGMCRSFPTAAPRLTRRSG
jgi:hypothetical protein